jgi:tripartite-type tricarboxylate transporter receptor subunit TctC
MNTSPKRRRILGGAVAAGALGLASPLGALAQSAADWPTRPIKLLVPFPPGGGVDNMARIVTERLAQQLGQPILVENQGGGGGTIASSVVARAPADGYTLIFHSVSGAVVNAVTLKNLKYDPINDFTPVTLVSRFPLVMVTNRDIPARDLKEFIALLKANPGKYSYGSSGVGTSIHLASELFKSMAGVDIVHVPYKGTVAVIPDLIAGRVAMLIDGVPPQLPHIASKKVRALAVTTTTRTDVLPDVPAVNEVLPGYDIPFWTAIFAPANTPRAIVEKIAFEVNKAVKHPETARKLRESGIEGVGSSPAEFDAYWRKQLAVYGQIAKDANVKIEQ